MSTQSQPVDKVLGSVPRPRGGIEYSFFSSATYGSSDRLRPQTSYIQTDRNRKNAYVEQKKSGRPQSVHGSTRQALQGSERTKVKNDKKRIAGKAKGKNLAKMRKKQQTISRESDQNKMLCRFGLRSFKNTTPNDLEALQKLPGITYEEGKLLGKLAVKAQNWSLAEVAYKLCLQYQLNEKGCREEAAIADTVQLSPIKRKSAMRRNNNNSSSVTKMLNYEQKWQTRSMSSFEAASERQGQNNITQLSVSRSRRTSPKLFNFLDNVSEAKSMSRETLARLSKCRQKSSVPPISDPKCAASGKWRGRQGGRFSNSKPKSDVDWIIYRSKQIPGPGEYKPLPVEAKKGVKFSDANPKSEVEWIIYHAKQLPGPGQYPLKSTLSNSAVKFSDANPKSDLEWTIYNASQVPGPAHYNIELCP